MESFAATLSNNIEVMNATLQGMDVIKEGRYQSPSMKKYKASGMKSECEKEAREFEKMVR